MKILISNDTDQAQQWAYDNGINKYPPKLLAHIYYEGCSVTDEAFPGDIELEADVEGEHYTGHDYGSTTAVETHPAEIIEARYNGKPVEVTEWLRNEIWRQL